METNVKAIELKDLWRRYKATGDEPRASASSSRIRRW